MLKAKGSSEAHKVTRRELEQEKREKNHLTHEVDGDPLKKSTSRWTAVFGLHT